MKNQEEFSFLDADKGNNVAVPVHTERLLGVGRTGALVLETMIERHSPGCFDFWYKEILPYIQQGKITDSEKLKYLYELRKKSAISDLENLLDKAQIPEHLPSFDEVSVMEPFRNGARKILKKCEEDNILSEEEVNEWKAKFKLNGF